MTETKEAPFAKGDRIAWDHTFATQHAPGSIIRSEAIDGQAPEAQLGKVVKVANDEGTYFEVQLDDAKKGETVTLTADELVKVADDA